MARPALSARAQGAPGDRYDVTMADCDETSEATGGEGPGGGTVETTITRQLFTSIKGISHITSLLIQNRPVSGYGLLDRKPPRNVMFPWVAVPRVLWVLAQPGVSLRVAMQLSSGGISGWRRLAAERLRRPSTHWA